MVACIVQGLALRGVQEDHPFVLTGMTSFQSAAANY
jgi:hypothetical protein